mgnify:CR=1 FL=1
MNQLLGSLVILTGGVFAACYLLPLRAVKGWAYETSWLFYALVGLLVYPSVLGLLTVPDFFGVVFSASAGTLLKVFAYGVVWGVGALCWGLMVRYLGIGLGLAVGCGLCAATGTLLPPVVTGHAADLVKDAAACTVLGGVLVSIVGIVLTGLAGKSKEAELDEATKKAGVKEFDFRKGMLLGVVSGVASGAINFGLQGAPELESAALEAGAASAWAGMPVLAVVLAGGWLSNTVWAIGSGVVKRWRGGVVFRFSTIPVLHRSTFFNLLFAGAVGVIGVSQFACQKIGEPLLGDMRYISFAVLMAAAILVSTAVGVFTGEWKGTGKKTRLLLAAGVVVLVAGFTVMSMAGR